MLMIKVNLTMRVYFLFKALVHCDLSESCREYIYNISTTKAVKVNMTILGNIQDIFFF